MFVAATLSSTSALVPTPGPMSGAFSDTSTQLASLTVVMNEFKDPRLEALLTELAKTRLDLERSRMAEEDTRSASMKAFDTLQRRQDEIREERRREENRRFWDNHHMRLGTTAGWDYL